MKKQILEQLKNPGKGLLALVYPITLLFIGGAIGILFVDYEGTWLEYLAYTLFGLSAVALAYSTYTFVRIAPKIKAGIIKLLQSKPLTNRILKSYGFRTVLFSGFSMGVSVLYGLYNGGLAVAFHSMWYGALAVYYITLVFMRIGIVLYHGKRRGQVRDEYLEIRKFRNVGWLLVSTISALSAAILQMVKSGAGFVHAGLTIYVSATYTFYKMTMSIVNMFKAGHQEDYTIKALRSVNFADALVSILALQTAMFQEFATATENTAVANAVTGAGVCALVLTIGVIMIVKGQKSLNSYKRKEKNERTE